MPDYTGQKHGKLTFLRYSRPGGGGKGAYWMVRCDCGNRKEVIAKAVRSGRIRTCGECISFQAMRKEEQRGRERARKQMGKELDRAIWEGGEWHLSPMQFYKLLEGKCVFCGSQEQLGAVRIGREGGYSIENTAPECRKCRNRRGRDTATEFIEYCMRVAAGPQKVVDDQ